MKDSKGLDSNYIRVSLTLPDELDRALQKLGSDIRVMGGYKMPKTTIIRALIRLLMTLELDLTNVKTEDKFLECVIQAARKL